MPPIAHEKGSVWKKKFFLGNTRELGRPLSCEMRRGGVRGGGEVPHYLSCFFQQPFFPLPKMSSAQLKVEMGVKGKLVGGSSCFHPYLITLHPLSPYRPTCPMLFPGILIPEEGARGGEGVWDGKTKESCQSL